MLRKLWNKTVPYKIRELLSVGTRLNMGQIDYDNKMKKIMERYGNSTDTEIQESISYMKKRKAVSVFNASFVEKYEKLNIVVQHDAEDFPYVLWEGKKMYFPKSFSDAETRDYTKRLMIEQDSCSPHCYLDRVCDVQENDIIFDCGGAEGNFTLSVIDKVKKAVIFESEDEWVQALEKTFANYQEKIVICKKFVCDKTDDNTISIDDYVNQSHIYPTFVKMDIEGAEISALKGMAQVIRKQDKLKCAICAYHRENDLENILKLLDDKFQCKISDGYMCLERENDFYFARGVVRCVSKKITY